VRFNAKDLECVDIKNIIRPFGRTWCAFNLYINLKVCVLYLHADTHTNTEDFRTAIVYHAFFVGVEWLHYYTHLYIYLIFIFIVSVFGHALTHRRNHTHTHEYNIILYDRLIIIIGKTCVKTHVCNIFFSPSLPRPASFVSSIGELSNDTVCLCQNRIETKQWV